MKTANINHTNIDIDETEDRALGIMNGSVRPTETDVKDERLLSLCHDIEEAAGAIDDTDIDVESQLKRFHKRHTKKSKAIVWGLVAMAACLAGLAFILFQGNKKVNLNDSPIAYDEVRNLKEIEVIGSSSKQPIEAKASSTTKVFNVMDCNPSDVVLTAAIPTGDNYEVKLSDGTRVLLHGNSRLVFPSRFVGKQREVKLDGEAYFIVAHDPSHPFIVHCGKMTTEVLGTEFYARSEKGSNDVTLIKGQVKVSTPDLTYKIYPGQQVLVTPEGKSMAKRVDVTAYEYWRDGYLFYDNATLRSILENIAREYGFNIEWKTETLSTSNIRFITDRTKGINGILTDLNDITGLHIKILKNSIIVQ